MTASYQPYQLTFRSPVLTSRGSMVHKKGYYITVEQEGVRGLGECSYIEGLSPDKLDDLDGALIDICAAIETVSELFFKHNEVPAFIARPYPAIAFGLETALLDWANGGKHEIVPGSAFRTGQQAIPINGLVWMGPEAAMKQQVDQKIAEGYRCIKIKVAAIDFDEECRLIESIRLRYPPDQIEIRLDANGGFAEAEVRDKLKTLAQFTIHSIEQPIRPQQYVLMHELCREEIIPIALDEELIGTSHTDMKVKMLETIRPQYIILKPSLLGGMKAADEWIEIAEGLGIAWWATSALESNVGLNAIAQWAGNRLSGTNPMCQGLGTGGLYVNNIESPLYTDAGYLRYKPDGVWGM